MKIYSSRRDSHINFNEFTDLTSEQLLLLQVADKLEGRNKWVKVFNLYNDYYYFNFKKIYPNEAIDIDFLHLPTRYEDFGWGEIILLH